MKFTAERKRFLGAVIAASDPIRRSHLPILECLHVIAKDNRLRLIGSNMDVEVQAICDAAVASPGEFSIDAGTLRAALTRSDGDVCEVVLGEAVSLTCGRVSAEIPAMIGKFPRLQPPGAGVEVDRGMNAMAFCAPFAANEKYASWAQGVHFGGDFATAYDGASFAWHEVGGGDGQIIPRESVAIAQRIGERLFLTDRAWRAESEGAHAAGKLLEGPYHSQWRSLMKPGAVIASFDADAVSGAINAATIGGARRVILSLSGPSLVATGDNDALTKARKSEAECACDADTDVKMVMDAAKMAGILGALSGSIVNLSISGPAAFFIPNGGAARGCALGMMRDARNSIPGEVVAA